MKDRRQGNMLGVARWGGAPGWSVAQLTKRKWYAEGLAFECTQCGNCCSGPPGYVWVTKEEVARIARFLGRKDDALDRQQVRRVGLKQSLTEKANGDCVFLKREGGKALCSVYEARPSQCRTWTFWSENVESIDAWNRAGRNCPGMDRGKRHDFVALEELRLKKW